MKVRKIIAVLLAAVMVFAIAITASAEEKTLKVGVACNATGWFADYDANCWEELVIYADMLNEEGGIKVGDDNYKVELVLADGQSDFAGMPTACMDLIDKGVDLVIETNDFWMVDGNQLLKDAGILTLSDYPDFATGFWTDANGNVNDCLVSCANGAANDIVALLTTLGEVYPDAHTIMYVCNADGTEAVKYQYVKSVCDAMGYELLEQYEVYDSSAPDMTAIAQKVAAADPDAYIGQGVISCIGQLIAALQDYDPDCICLASCGQNIEVLANIIGDSTKCNKIISTGIGFDKEKNPELMNVIYDKLVEKFDEATANSWAGNMVNCLKVYKDIVEKIGTIDKDAILDYWKNAETLSTVYSDEAHLGGKESFGLDFNRMIVNPTPISTLDNGVATYLGWFQFDVK